MHYHSIIYQMLRYLDVEVLALLFALLRQPERYQGQCQPPFSFLSLWTCR